ncbi:MAG TPA: IS1634 family transposase [Cryomorphaceae bacterium]|nr:IS1634 family transposase [Cryomorphaceae bacterium]
MQIKSSSTGDLPLLAEILDRSHLAELIDQHLETHPHRQGPSVGKTIQIWLMYILSQMDHRLSSVEPWVKRSLEVLRWVCEEPELQPCHLSDDYLGTILELMDRHEEWLAYEAEQHRHIVQVFDLRQETVRLDATNVSSYRTPEGLFQIGHSKKGGSALAQLKVMLASLDPWAIPIASCSFPGHRADDQLYIPVIKQAQEQLPSQGLLYVGDTKLGNKKNFAYLDQTGNAYLSPLSKTQFDKEQLEEAIHLAQQDQQAIRPVYKDDQLIAQVYELPEVKCREPAVGHQWTQRHILVKSVQLAQRQSASLKKRIKKAQKEILERFLPKQGRKIFSTVQEARTFVNKVLKRRKVKKYITPDYELVYDPKRNREIAKCRMSIETTKLEQALEQMGWRVYATNSPASRLEAEQVVTIYRRQYRIEQNFHQLLKKVTRLMPVFLSKENRIENLIRLSVLALKFSAVIQYKVRKALDHSKGYMVNLIPYSPGQKVENPTTYRLLQAFKDLQLFIIQEQGKDPTYQVEPLKDIQVQILELLEIPLEVYLHPCQRT